MSKDSSRRPPEDPSWRDALEDDPDQAMQEMRRGLARARALVRRAHDSLSSGDLDGDGSSGTGGGARR